MSETPTDGRPFIELARPLRRSRLSTRIVMMAERMWPLALPLLIVILLFLTAAWFGLFRWLPDQSRIGLAAVLAIGAIGALTLLRHFRLPTRHEVDSRLEQANRLQHTPLQVQDEQPGGKADIFADALWREHQRRMAGKLRNLTSDLPRPNIPDVDKWGLRSVAVLLAVTAFAFSYGSSGGRLADAFMPASAINAEPPRIDAWVTPPAYTGKPPIFLTAEANRETKAFTVPAGSELSMRVTGGSGDETLAYLSGGNERLIEPKGAEPKKDGAPQQAQPAAPPPKSGNQQFSTKLGDNGAVSLKQGAGELARWDFTITPDRPPAIRYTEEPRQAVNGTLELRYEITDDYGPASGSGEFALVEPQKPEARPLFEKPELKLALPRRAAVPPVARSAPDLTEHVWAGVPISLVLKVVDAAGQEATSEVKRFILPERSFTNPLARAVVEMRRLIGLDANQRPQARELLDAITLRPEDTIKTPAHYIALMSLRTRLDMAQTDDQLREVVAYMWQIAVGIEDGELSDAEKRLRQAQQALKDALERGASEEEIDRLMKELRQAMNEFLREFAERSQKNQNGEQMPMDGKMLTQNDLQKMLDAIEKQAKSGNRDQAQAMLDELQNLMNNLQAGRQQQQQQGENGQQGEMRQQMNKLGDIMRRQQEMMNETHRLEQERNRGQQQGQQGDPQQGQQGQQGEQGQGQMGQGQGQGQSNQPMSEEEFAEAMRQLQEGQGKLQQELDQLQENLRGMGIQPGQGFGEAGEQMGEAQTALGQQRGEQATGHQGQALESLRRGAQDMMNQMQAMQGDQGGSEEGGRSQRNAGRDPLGRPQRNTGYDDNGMNPDLDSPGVERARQILEAIRKRLGNALSPELERSYLERLLDMQ